jgi:hypothetical protein
LPGLTRPAALGAPAGAVLRAAVVHLGVLLAAGVVVGLAWAAVAPAVAARSDGIESQLSGEVAFAGLGLLAGVAVAIAGLVRPGSQPVVGAAVRLLGSVVASVLAWGVGRLAGAPVLAAPGVVVIWPLATAVTTALVTLVLVLAHPDGSPAGDQ